MPKHEIQNRETITQSETLEVQKQHKPIRDCFQISPELIGKILTSTLPKEVNDQTFSKTKKIIDEHIKTKGYNQPSSPCSQVIFAMENLRKLHSENNNAIKHTKNVIQDIINKKNNSSESSSDKTARNTSSKAL
ncbi:hypothetical protein NOVO_06460 [Rickettsiales bacterium Ac37b]|nr:hypothetical protein NOVO_06460 [Rickettsiales bacterium Ac37b]